MEIKFYVRIPQNFTVEGFPFQFTTPGGLGSFELQTQYNTWFYGNFWSSFSINGTTNSSTFLTNVYDTSTQHFINESEINFSSYVELGIVDQMTSPLPMNQAYFPNICSDPVAKAQISITGPYRDDILLSFTSENGSQTNEFIFKHTILGTATGGIPFSLFLDGSNDPVVYSTEYTWESEWEGLSSWPSTYTKDIRVGHISQQTVESRVAGNYSETIYIHITAPN